MALARNNDTVATDHAELVKTELATRPADRAMLGAFTELVRTAGARPVADVGPAMVVAARMSYPGLRFDMGSMTRWTSRMARAAASSPGPTPGCCVNRREREAGEQLSAALTGLRTTRIPTETYI